MSGLLLILCLFVTVKTSNITDLQRQTVRLGDGVTVKCHQKVAKGDLVWYKQSLGMLPQYIVRKVGNKANSPQEFKTDRKHRFSRAFENSRFTVDDKTFDLSINGVKDEDKGIYFCGKGQLATLEFLSGTILLFAGEHSVYWFRNESGESHPGIICIHPHTSDECEKSSETESPTQSCIHNLPKRNFSLSDAGIHYCAVAACGDDGESNGKESNTWIIVVLTISNMTSLIVMMLLGTLLYQKKQKGSISGRPGSPKHEVEEDTDVLNYATVNFAQKPPSRAPRVKQSQDIYSGVKVR
ncbi:uncharacterized protein LOC108411027 [Pygocentrus nattereri]|uniref:uncharacterized protein LOC108411027 n=1 Tax=Pygocentrus nattereri TaxID=42514 RepID=UPI00081463A0|nr:uncharacterized protein LOC108411027 [Pygocentrus nattereri]